MVRDLAIWWLTCSALGWLTWPLAARLFSHSPGRGYVYARAMGLVLLSYLYWLPGVLGLWPNGNGSLWGVIACLALAGSLVGLRHRADLGQWVRREWRHILITELLFALTLVIYAWYKAHDPAIDHTEEPMDFAFLNAMFRSPRMPPNDPWLAGFKISYYYLGYLTISLVARLAGVSSGVAYNLGLAQTLALSVVGAYGVLHDLLAGRRGATLWGVVGGTSLGLAGNLEGFLELVRSRGLGREGFYRWLDIPGLAEAPATGTWLPQGDWWWWRASRTISDPNILARSFTVITEFPAFSFILGDLHPHVMALPTVLLALGLAVEIYRAARWQPAVRWWRRPSLWIMPLFYGALGMLNSWDLPAMVLIAGLALALGRWQGPADGWRWLRDVVLWGAWVGLASILLYLPFYRGLSSQAQGLGLAYYAKTPLKQYLIHLAPWIIPITGEGIITFRRLRLGDRRIVRRLWLALLLLPWLGTLLLGGWGRFLLGLATVALRGPWLLLLQSALLAVLLWCMLPSLGRVEAQGAGCSSEPETTLPGGDELGTWTRLFLVMGLAVTYATEFVYLRDLFDTRMNTMFKFYYQAWVLLGIGATLAAYRLSQHRGLGRILLVTEGLVLCACLTYPAAAAVTRARAAGGPLVLDGTAYLSREDPAMYGAYLWLAQHAGPQDVLAEAVGEEYHADHNRLSAWTGVPTILGWAGHEIQWRGDDREVKRRMADVEGIYRSANRDEVLETLAKYSCTYLFVGRHERARYDIDQARLQWYATFLFPVYEVDGVVLYRLPSSLVHPEVPIGASWERRRWRAGETQKDITTNVAMSGGKAMAIYGRDGGAVRPASILARLCSRATPGVICGVPHCCDG